MAAVTVVCGALCGALLGFPWAAHFAWLAPLTLFPVFQAYRSGKASRCVWLTALFTMAQLLVGLHWIYTGAVGLQGDGAYYTSAIALVFECIPYALLGLVASRLARLPTLQWSIAVAGLWTLCEFWRGTSLLGVPYVQIGHGLIDTPLVGLAAIGGTEALTFVSVLGGAMVYELSQRTRMASVAALALCASAFAIGAVAPSPQSRPAGGGASVAILQYGHVDSDTFFEYLDEFRSLHVRSGFAVWPESALDLRSGSGKTAAIRAAVRAKHVPLLAGGMVADDSGTHDALVYFDRDGNAEGYYAKRQLIPFSEDLPFPRLARVIIPKALLNDVMRFTPGAGPVTFAIGNRIVGPLVCYESAFPALARDEVDKGANLLVAASDDGWFSGASGFWELSQTARLAAIETGTPMIVDGTVGPSGAIDAGGHWIDELPIDAPMSAVLTAPAAHKTIYDAIGDGPPLFSLAALIVLAVFKRDASLQRQNRLTSPS